MSKDEREFLDALRTKSIEAAAEILEGVQRLKTLYDDLTDDGSGTPVPKPRLGDHFYQLAKFELEHASALIRLGNSHAEMIFEHLRTLARRTQKTASPVLVLEPASAEAKSCAGGFDVRNPFDKPADLRFELGQLKTATGDPAPNGAVLRADGKNGAKTVRGYDSIIVEVSADRPAETLFGDIKVFLSADIEKQVAHRVVKVRSTKVAP